MKNEKENSAFSLHPSSLATGLINPDQGRIEMRGRIGALIELGAGFNPILTGRENIDNKGAVLGFSKQETDGKFDSIIYFAVVEDFYRDARSE